MTRIIILVFVLLFNVSANAQKYPLRVYSFDNTSFEEIAPPTLMLGERKFLGTYEKKDHEMAIRHAKNVGGIIRPFGIYIREIDRKTNKVIDYIYTIGESVWR